MTNVEVIAVFGSTASGKTAAAEALSGRLGTEVVSADALQMYAGLPIVTNQPDRPIRLVAVWPLHHEGSVAEYARMAHDAVDELVQTRGVAVLAGGTGLYLRAALGELELPPRPAPEARARWTSVYDANRVAAHAELASRDRAAATLVHVNDRRRVVRALELAEAGDSLVPAQDQLWGAETRRPSLVVGLEVPKEELARRIVERTDEMFRRGVVREVRDALAQGDVSQTAEKALGLREIAELEPGEARAAIVRRTTRYAAYQRKWMRRIPGIVMIDGDRHAEEVADAILEVARTR